LGSDAQGGIEEGSRALYRWLIAVHTEAISSPCGRDNSSLCVRAATLVPGGAASNRWRCVLDGTGHAMAQ
jgi:hypothetical protein